VPPKAVLKPAPRKAAPKRAKAAARKPARAAPKAAPKPARRRPARTGKAARPAKAKAPKAAAKAPPRGAAVKATREADLPVVDGLTTLVLAKSEVADGKLQLRTRAPKRLMLPTLHVLRVEHAYELQRSRGKEPECRFVLRARLGGQEPAPDLVRTGDAWAASKERTGYAQQVFRIPPGRSQLEYELIAECYGKPGEPTQRRVAKGIIPIKGI
jgi:hypothetical protein